ncbi:MAG: class I SAM-dependent methyltransferase [Oscillospiraceae bacterium]|nr:class I SAM-dependent methyltransferase [Oscillospiraceae bacterium]
MIDLISLEKSFVAPHLKKGGVAVDFTMGNGHDTLYLSDSIGIEGKVYAFDIQKIAVDSTRALLQKEALYNNYTLICDSHANIEQYVKEPICVGIFNLGYLPGGDKSITTMRASTLAAVNAGINLLGNDAILLIAVYPGHAEGTAEGEMLISHLQTLDRKIYCVGCFKIINSPSSPFFISIEKK